MDKFNFSNEWDFITTETHEKTKRISILKREILFALQILLYQKEFINYSKLKKIYYKN
jgi:hypothetical protein